MSALPKPVPEPARADDALGERPEALILGEPTFAQVTEEIGRASCRERV